MNYVNIDQAEQRTKIDTINIIKSTDYYEPNFNRFDSQSIHNDYTKFLHENYKKSQVAVDGTSNAMALHLKDAKIIGDAGFYPYLFDASSGSLLWGQSIGYYRKFLFKDTMEHFQLPGEDEQITILDDERPYAFVSQHGQAAYGHVLLDIVPRIYVAKSLLGDNIRVALVAEIAWIMPLLSSIGIRSDSILLLERPKVYRFDNLFVPLLPRFPGVRGVNVEILRRAWHHFTGLVPGAKPIERNPTGVRIFISRTEVGSKRKVRKSKRCITNEDALYDIAKDFGFMRVSPQQLSFANQIELFAAAEYIVGEDGSALHNAMLCKMCRAMIVLMHPARDNLWHLACAQAGDMDFHAIKCQTNGETYSADPAEFAALLAKVCS